MNKCLKVVSGGKINIISARKKPYHTSNFVIAMGAMNSCCIPQRIRYKDSIGNHQSTFNSSRCHGHNFSAAFNLSNLADEGDQFQSLLNINNATEEELMTLPGINRNTAQNIIEYRCRIGGFKKVEDLALVSGVGAAKLGVMRPEICVSQKRSSSSRGSSPGSSRQDVNLNERSMRRSNSNAQLRINVNSANVFQLMKVKGVGQLIAENIVAHRDKKGPFKSLDELSKVKGIGAGLLGAIRHHLTLSDIDVSSATISTIANHSLSSTPKQLQNANGHLPNVGQTEKEDNAELSAKLNNSFEDLLELLGPLARKSIRPKVQPFNFKRNNTPAIRIATWNLDGCSADKIFNPGVRDVICMTVLENGLGLIAVQEIADIEALEKICGELNNPTLPNVKKWKGAQGKWEYVMANPGMENIEHNGFIYDVKQGVKLTGTSLLNFKATDTCHFECQSLAGSFQVKGFDCLFVNIYHKNVSENTFKNEDDSVGHLAEVLDSLQETASDEPNVTIFGNIEVELGAQVSEVFESRGYKRCVPNEMMTSLSPCEISRSISQPRLRSSSNNVPVRHKSSASLCSSLVSHNGMTGSIWLNKNTRQMYTGCGGAVREGLTNILIPHGWMWGGPVSKFCPTWMEFYTEKDFDCERLSSGIESIKFTLSD